MLIMPNGTSLDLNLITALTEANRRILTMAHDAKALQRDDLAASYISIAEALAASLSSLVRVAQ